MSSSLGQAGSRARTEQPALDTSVVSLSGIRKSYGDFVAVDNFSLDLRKGEFLCLLGPSGCGKTTTLRMIAGFVEPTAGTIHIDGKEVSKLPPYRRDTGMVFQAYALFPHMSIAQNVAFGLENINLPKAEIRQRVQEMLELVELSHLAERYPRELSGGQQQRVALARALALRPAVLLLDEPFSNLDAQLRVRLRDELKRLIDQVDITTLFVTHDQEEALTLSDRIVVLNAGKIEQIGTPEEIYASPASRFVAEFIGWCSLLEGEIVDGVFTTRSGFSLQVPPQVLGRSEGRQLLMLRPECIKPWVGGTAGMQLGGVVESVNYYGAMTRMTLLANGEKLLMEAHFPFGRQPHVGDEMAIALDPEAIRLIPS